MIIEVPHSNLHTIRGSLKQFKLRHGPFRKEETKYKIYLYPSKKLTLFLIKHSEDVKEILGSDAGVAQG